MTRFEIDSTDFRLGSRRVPSLRPITTNPTVEVLSGLTGRELRRVREGESGALLR